MIKTKTFYIQKLVRDGIVSKLEKENISCDNKILTDAQYLQELKAKTVEEAKEILNADTKINLIEEIADISEVLKALMKFKDISQEEVDAYRMKKNNKSGRFETKLWIETITAPEGSSEYEYLSKNSDRYKEKTQN